MKTFSALICGYGVPKNIFDDKNYHAYLTACFNQLFDNFCNQPGIIVVNGGPTDCYRPYRRTEAGEIAKWLIKKKTETEKMIGKKLAWQIISQPKSLSSVENLLNFLPFTKEAEQILIFCEKIRWSRIKKLMAVLCRSKQNRCQNKIKIIPIDFDGSARRYTPLRTTQSEKKFLKMELAAIEDLVAREKLRKFMKEKLKIMRKYSAEEAHRRLPKILEKLHQKFMAKGKG